MKRNARDVPSRATGLRGGVYARLADSWTIGFLRKWQPIMGMRSALAYRNLTLRGTADRLRGGNVCLRMRRPFRGEVVLREVPSDLMTFTEIIEWDVYGPVFEHVPKATTVIDLGANIGLSSLCFAARWPGCRVVAVEPNTETFALLERNLSPLVRQGRCEVVKAAIWSRETALVGDASVPKEKFNWFRLAEAGDGSEAAPGGYPGISMATLMRRCRIDDIGLLKIDIEGAETELFQGDVSWLGHTQAIAIEFHQTAAGNTRQLVRFDELMRQYGMTVVAETPHTTVAVRPAT
jgi:FkbM family methyltransferase